MSVIEAGIGPRAALDLLRAERSFRCMGTDAHVLVWVHRRSLTGPEALLDAAERSLARLEDLWSRFIPTSDVCRVNDAAGAMVEIDPDTFEILSLAMLAHDMSDGLFDATLLHELESAGYDRTFSELPPVRLEGWDAPAAPQRRAGIELDHARCAAACPPGRAIDLGGIGKGRAADLVVAELLRDGASGACVNLGGDLRVAGESDAPTGTIVGVEDPFGGPEPLTVIELRNAAVATSSRARRRWTSDDGITLHHLIDPSTGRPSSTHLLSVTVVAPTATLAEVSAKASFLGGTMGTADNGETDLPTLLVDGDGSVMRRAGFEELER